MVSGLENAYVIYECWTSNDDVGHWMLANNIQYSIRVTADNSKVPPRLKIAGVSQWVIYSAYLTGEAASVIALTFPGAVVSTAKTGPDVRVLIKNVVEKISS